MTVRWTVRAAERLCPQAKKSFCPCQKNRQVSTCRFFYSSRRLGMESRVSVYGIAVGAWHHRRCIFCGLIPYRLATDSIQCFALIPYTPHGVMWRTSSSPYESSPKYLFCPPFTIKTAISASKLRIDSGFFMEIKHS